MSVVAPVTGVLAAALPVLAGLLLDGIPGPSVLVGFAVAILAVILVSRAPGENGSGRAGLAYAVAAGIGFSLFAVLIAQVTDGLVAGPLVVVRLAASSVMVLLIVVARRPWRIGRPLWRLVVLVGVLDMAGNLFFIASAQAYRLDVAAALSSLYPVVTVILAAVVLRERIVGGHALGIGLAALAIVLIAGGSTG